MVLSFSAGIPLLETGQQYWLGANSGALQYDRQMDRLDRLVG